jgi:hypothetical protein
MMATEVPSSFLYSLEDFEEDCGKLRAFQDVGVEFLGQFEFDKGSKVKACLKHLRFLNFAEQAIEAELECFETGVAEDDYILVGRNESPDITQQEPRSYETIGNLLNCMPLYFVADNIPGMSRYSSANSSGGELVQEKKDVERDKYIVNGIIFVGGPSSNINDFMTLLTRTLDTLLMDARFPELPLARKKSLINSIIRNGSRTHCGGVSYATLQHASESCVQEHLIVPLSTEVTPIRIRMRLGKLEGFNEKLSWGLRVEIESESFYKLKDANNFESSDTNAVKVTFSMLVGTELDFNCWSSNKVVESNRRIALSCCQL